MNMTVFGVVAATATVATTALTAMPAQALSLSGTLNFTGEVVIDGTSDDFSADFINAVVSGVTSSGDFAGASGAGISDFSIFGGELSPDPVDPFLSGIVLASGDIVDFVLTGFEGDTGFFVGAPGGAGDIAVLEGFFVNGDTTVAAGSLTTQLASSPTGTTYSSSLTAVEIPTPALLPGLVGMGVAALRKRKALAEEA